MSHADPHEPVDALLAQWLQARHDGQPVDGETIRQQHPESAAEVAAFLHDYQQVDRRFEPLRLGKGPGKGVRSILCEAPSGPFRQNAPDPFSERATLGQDDTAVPDLPQAGSSFGDYDLLAEVARGGMGVVYKARQRSLNRVVALKMVLGGGRVSATDRERFLVEARAVARLNHPHIVPIYEVGEHHGQSYFTMEFFAGDSLRGRIEEFRRDQRAISRLMATVARAVEHAHRRGILHRDLKPGNVLLDERREPHVTDFGLAKRLDEESDLTQAGAIVGTPSYMAPEQANAQADLSTAVDVYGLGAVLYELLTGRPPFRGQTPMETLLSVMSGEPPRPRKLDGQVDADLETICLKCLAKDPLARYGSADALADDLERWLAGEPIQARRASLRERAVKWARRQPVLAGAFGAAAILALGCLVACGLSWRNAELRAEAVSDLGHARQQLAAANDDVEKAKSLADKQRELADRQKQLADEQKQLAEQTRGEVERLKQAAEVETAKAAAAQKQRELAEQQARRTLYAADMQLAHVAWQTEDMGTLSELVERYRDPAGQEDLRGFEWHYLNRQARGGRLAWQASQEPGHFKTSGVAISPDGKTVATVFTYYAGKTTIKTWSLADGKLLRTMDAGQATVTGLFFTVQGRELVAVVHEELDVLRKRSVLQAAAKKKEKLDIGFLKDQFEYRTWSLDQDDPPRVEPFDPARLRCRVSVGAIGSCLTQHEGEILSVLSLTTSPDGKYLALGGAALDHRFGFVAAPRGRLILWDISRGAVHGQAQSPRWIVEAAAFSPDGKRLAIGHEEGTIEVREVVTAGQPQRLIRHPGQVFALQFSPDSARLASGAGSGQVQLWDVAAGHQVACLRGHASAVQRADFAPDGQTLVSVARDGAVKVWDLARPTNPLVLRGEAGGLVFSADGSALTSVTYAGTVKTWRLADSQVLRDLPAKADDRPLNLAALSGGGTTMAWLDTDDASYKTNLVRDLATGKQRRIVWKSVLLCSSALSHDGRLIASASILNDGRCDVGVRDVAEGKQLASLTVSTYQVRSLAFSSDAKLLAIVCQNTVLLWDWQSDKAPRILESRPAVNAAAARSYGGVAFAADTSQLAVVDGDRIRIWDLQTGQVRTECREAGPSAEPRAFTPDGRRLLTMGWTLAGQGFVKLWDTTSGREVFSAALPPVRLAATALSADGRRLAAAMVPLDSSVGTADRPLPAEIYVWDATPLATD